MARSRTTSSFNELACAAMLGLASLLAPANVLAQSPATSASSATPLPTTPPPMTPAPPAATAGEPSASDVETAKAQFIEGLDLRSKGDVAGALQRFRAAYALVPTPITALELGRTLVASGKVLEGREVLLDASRMPKKPDESDKAQQARDAAARDADDARAKLATLAIDTDFDADPIVIVDDKPIPKDAVRAPRVLDPGHHVVVVRAKGRVGRVEVDLRSGAHDQIHVQADALDTSAEPPSPPPPPPVRRMHPNAVVWVGGIGTGAGLLVGIATGVGAFVTAGDVKAQCPNSQCPPASHGNLDASLALGWTSTIAFVAAGAFAVVGVIGLFTSRPREHSTSAVRVGIGPGSIVLGGQF